MNKPPVKDVADRDERIVHALERIADALERLTATPPKAGELRRSAPEEECCSVFRDPLHR